MPPRTASPRPSDLALFRRDNRVTMQALRKADAEAAEQVENALRDREIAMAEVEREAS